MEEKEVRKTVPKKVVRKTAKVAKAETPVRTKRAASTRKAPARRVESEVVQQKRSAPSKPLFIALAVCVIIIGGAIAFGYSDTGEINVTQVISDRKQNASPEEQELFRTIPVQQGQSTVANGGLVGSGKSEPTPPPPTATSTDQIASSTEQSVTSSPQLEGDEATEEESVEEGPQVPDDETASSSDAATPAAQ